jgi:hypothetical protein
VMASVLAQDVENLAHARGRFRRASGRFSQEPKRSSGETSA